jgi:hypothetical protein
VAKDSPDNPKQLTPAENTFIRQLVHAQANSAVREICIRRYGDSYNTNYPTSVGKLVHINLAEYFAAIVELENK